jgi:flagellar biosynthesis GTPase FlhF
MQHTGTLISSCMWLLLTTIQLAPSSMLQTVEEWLDQALSGQSQEGVQRCSKCCCISGPTGCGRSTTLQLLAQVQSCLILSLPSDEQVHFFP